VIHDKFRKKYRIPQGSSRLRRQIALEAARRVLQSFGPNTETDPDEPPAWLETLPTADLYVAKRKAAAVLGHRVRQGDLPSDSEVREQLVTLIRSGRSDSEARMPIADPDDHEDAVVRSLSDHLDRFTLFKLRLQPLEGVKQNSKYHPEGDALYHSLQVFELARQERPYDEEFLLAALLHDIGKAIAPEDHVAAAVEALRGAVTPRTLWLIAHHMDLLKAQKQLLAGRLSHEIEASEYLDDLKLLRTLDDAGRVPGQPVGSVEEALAYIQGLEREDYLDDPASGANCV
jgi:hypothetical protein